MNIGIAFALVALGMALDYVHHLICRKTEIDAFTRGYEQAQKEEKLANRYREFSVPQRPVLPETTPAYTAPTYRRQPVLPDGFVESLQSEGHAAAKIR